MTRKVYPVVLVITRLVLLPTKAVSVRTGRCFPDWGVTIRADILYLIRHR